MLSSRAPPSSHPPVTRSPFVKPTPRHVHPLFIRGRACVNEGLSSLNPSRMCQRVLSAVKYACGHTIPTGRYTDVSIVYFSQEPSESNVFRLTQEDCMSRHCRLSSMHGSQACGSNCQRTCRSVYVDLFASCSYESPN